MAKFIVLVLTFGLIWADDLSQNLDANLSLNLSIEEKKARFEASYPVKFDENFIVFGDKSVQIFDDGLLKSESEILENPDLEDSLEKYPAFVEISPPKSDAGRVRNYEFLGKIYGNSKSKIEENLVDVIWLKSHLNETLKFNHKNGAAKALQNASDELDKLVAKTQKC